MLSQIAVAAPTVTLSKKAGPPTSKILVSGRGFAPNVGVDIYFGTKDEALVVTNGRGEFVKTKIYTPRTAHPGKHWVSALERNNDKGAQEPFLVRTNWSQFRFSPSHEGVNPYENVVSTQTVGRLELKWTYAGDFNFVYGISSPAVANGVVYVGTTEGGANSLLALDAETGKYVWSFGAPSKVVASPALANHAVYFGAYGGYAYALNASTGAELWDYKVKSYEIDSSPAVADGLVYIGAEDGNMYALNADDGTNVWTYTTGGQVSCSPAVASGLIYFGSYDGFLALNASTGAKVWAYTANEVDSAPAVANGVVYVGSFDGNIYALNATNGALLWTYKTSDWVFSSPAVANGIVYVASLNHNLYALNAKTGALLWTYATAGSISSSPAIANGVVYVGSDDNNVYALNANTGALLWSYTTGGGVDSSPAVSDGMVYVDSGDGNVYAFGLGGTPTSEQAASKRPALNGLRPDPSLKPFQPKRNGIGE